MNQSCNGVSITESMINNQKATISSTKPARRIAFTTSKSSFCTYDLIHIKHKNSPRFKARKTGLGTILSHPVRINTTVPFFCKFLTFTRFHIFAIVLFEMGRVGAKVSKRAKLFIVQTFSCTVLEHEGLVGITFSLAHFCFAFLLVSSC